MECDVLAPGSQWHALNWSRRSVDHEIQQWQLDRGVNIVDERPVSADISRMPITDVPKSRRIMNVSSNCIFCRIASRDGIPSWVVWEDEQHIAFLTPTPNTPGFTVLATKEHLGSNVLRFPAARLDSLMRAAQTVSNILERVFGTTRVAMIAEGMGVDHAHLKLVPLHGITSAEWEPVTSNATQFTETYEGFISTHEGPGMPAWRLDAIAEQIRSAQSK